MTTLPRPGLAKTGPAPLVRTRSRELVATVDARWRELVDRAEVLSEGAPFGDGPERSYFGSSSLLLPPDESVGHESLAELARVAACDPHLRVRSIRCARREAAYRAGGPLDRVRVEVHVSLRGRAVLVRVDVEARVLPDRRSRPRPPLLTHAGLHANP